jgi:hypothetical protein
LVPTFHDASQVEQLNRLWKIVPDEQPPVDRSLKGRLRGFIWRVIGPTLDAQQRFNATLVDHVNRNTGAQARAEKATVALVEAARREVEALVRFEWLLLQFLQTITGYVDTKDRSDGGPELREQMALIQQRLAMVERQLSRGFEQPHPAAVPQAGTATPPLAFTGIGSVVYLGFEDRWAQWRHP